MKRPIVALIALSDDRQCLLKRATDSDNEDAPSVEVTFLKDYEAIFFEAKITMGYTTEEKRDEIFDKLRNETPEVLSSMYFDALKSSGMAELVEELETNIKQEADETN